VLGATREGLAPAKEQPGKMVPKYKSVTPGIIFCNPMRICRDSPERALVDGYVSRLARARRLGHAGPDD